VIKELTDALIGICRQFGAAERTAICCGDVNVAQCVALQFLKAGAQTVSALADYMGVTRGSATKLADGMEEKGWIVRVRDEDDGRRVLLQLSPDGIKLASELRQRTESLVNVTVNDLDKNDVKTLLRALQLLEKTLGSCCVNNSQR
jgi:DNA-binding MarR family transcriptional regulator